MKITKKFLDSLKPKEKLYRKSVGEGLFIEVRPNGKKFWVFRYSINNKPSSKKIGQYPYISYTEARDKVFELRNNLEKGLPINSNAKFNELFNDWFKNNKKKWAEKTAERKIRIYEIYIKDHLGNININEINVETIVNCLKKIMKKNIPETLKKAKQIINGVFRYAIACGYISHNPTSSISEILGTTNPKNKHYRSIQDPGTLKKLLIAIDGNIRTMQWDEIDFEKGLWNIPAEKMKMKRAHIVPLPRQAIEILNNIKPLTGDYKYVFAAIWEKGSKIMSDNTLNKVIKSIGFGDVMVSHSTRHTASTLLHEMGWPSIVIERQLAHVDKNTVRDTYNRAEYLETRKKMLQFWADYLDELKESEKPFLKYLNFSPEILTSSIEKGSVHNSVSS